MSSINNKTRFDFRRAASGDDQSPMSPETAELAKVLHEFEANQKKGPVIVFGSKTVVEPGSLLDQQLRGMVALREIDPSAYIPLAMAGRPIDPPNQPTVAEIALITGVETPPSPKLFGTHQQPFGIKGFSVAIPQGTIPVIPKSGDDWMDLPPQRKANHGRDFFLPEGYEIVAAITRNQEVAFDGKTYTNYVDYRELNCNPPANWFARYITTNPKVAIWPMVQDPGKWQRPDGTETNIWDLKINVDEEIAKIMGVGEVKMRYVNMRVGFFARMKYPKGYTSDTPILYLGSAMVLLDPVRSLINIGLYVNAQPVT